MPDATHDNSSDDGLKAIINQSYPVPEGLAIEPDPSLQGYQEELDSGGNNDIIENEAGTSPLDVTTMPARELKQELDRLAIDEHDATPENSFDEDRREHIEDVDEADKRD